ncbi:MAG: MBL fold metallo-hydrolase [Solirubrobacterales bacterium]|nr:MBL fold metallo-hydrolase [Solirubrobacterales bacterium]MCB0860578.1 MBL fold metallo-hydrolase [Solirubrobacterales bacterium]HRV59896.1 MBL fold metallo-hydrolase [Solirubrobacterales bacterium]
MSGNFAAMRSDVPETVDLFHFDQPGAIATHLFDGVIVDPGAEKTVDRLLEALGDDVPEAILLTHIHFDHAGATGRLVEKFPDVEVWVHEAGAPHMIDPERLVSSARKVFGDHFDMMWGEVVPVPEGNIRVLRGGESDGPWKVEYTPGHAKHHVCYLHAPTGTAFTGDVTGVRIEGGPAFPPTPPPDIDPPLWHESLETVRAWQPERVVFQHFGQATDVDEQIDMMHESLDLFAGKARETDAEGMSAWIRQWLGEQVGEAQLNTYWRAGPFEGMWSGLDRYWQKQQSGS